MTGNPSIDKIILGLNGIVVSAAVALIFYSANLKAPPANPEAEFTQMTRNSMVELDKSSVKFPEMIINLYSRQARLRFLNFKMDIEVFDDGQQAVIADYKSRIADTIIDIIGNMKPKELNSITGRILLESRIKKRVNGFIGQPTIKKIYFSKYIIQ